MPVLCAVRGSPSSFYQSLRKQQANYFRCSICLFKAAGTSIFLPGDAFSLSHWTCYNKHFNFLRCHQRTPMFWTIDLNYIAESVTSAACWAALFFFSLSFISLLYLPIAWFYLPSVYVLHFPIFTLNLVLSQFLEYFGSISKGWQY